MNEHAQRPPQPTGSMKPFAILVGEWKMVGTHSAFPSAVHGHSSFQWLVEGALLMWHFNCLSLAQINGHMSASQEVAQGMH